MFWLNLPTCRSKLISVLQVVQEALDKAKLTEKDLSAVAVTIGPGLSLCLHGILFLSFLITSSLHSTLYFLSNMAAIHPSTELDFMYVTGDDLKF